MNCTEFLAKLTDFFDGTIDPSIMEEVKTHLCSCHHCEVVVDTTRHTIDFYRKNEQYDLPSPVADRLRGAIMDRCRAIGVNKDGLTINSKSVTPSKAK
ncbi:anti-sigma factor family protein [Granulicella cerasi]|uniref:Anti-sigma factor family protein n=1 Tax=Granulicella cerasi TaxID=741063 RepID=A0ABW1Z4R3_9BACT|nr:zf-HC2 domain-containing protein [Granulicella cerasi]